MRYLVAALVFLAMNVIAMASPVTVGPGTAVYCDNKDMMHQYIVRRYINKEDYDLIMSDKNIGASCHKDVVAFIVDEEKDVVDVFVNKDYKYTILKAEALAHGENAEVVNGDIFVAKYEQVKTSDS